MEVFVFPLGHIVFYPSTSKPLNIFEPHYVRMVKDSIATGTAIAIGYVDEPDREHRYQYGESLSFVRSIAGFGMPLILEERADGSLLIFLEGKGKVRLGNTVNKLTPYIVCEAELISENHVMEANVIAELTTINKVLTQWIENRIPEKRNRRHFLKNLNSAEEIIGCFASYLVADHDMQQLLLETNDINEKIHLINGLIASGEII